jgi:hypothetical protein
MLIRKVPAKTAALAETNSPRVYSVFRFTVNPALERKNHQEACYMAPATIFGEFLSEAMKALPWPLGMIFLPRKRAKSHPTGAEAVQGHGQLYLFLDSLCRRVWCPGLRPVAQTFRLPYWNCFRLPRLFRRSFCLLDSL